MIDALLERSLFPDSLVRLGIRRLLGHRLRAERKISCAPEGKYLRNYVDDLKSRPIAEDTRAANEQHYEVPAAFFHYCLGPKLKYSSGYFATGKETLAEAETAMLELYVERAGLRDGQRVLDLGCGWGSLSLYLAERFPRSEITGVSNSQSQRVYILSEAKRRGLRNVEIQTCDINIFEAGPARFDRVLSVEMFEHMKNYQQLLKKVAGWIVPGGKLFVHIFTHRTFAYHFVAQGPSDWMARYFFTGGQMPSHDLLKSFQDDLRLLADWKLPGTHYQLTAEQWLRNMDANRDNIMPLFVQTYSSDDAAKWWSYWRTFYMSCAELWGYRGGTEWLVSHYLFERQT